MAQKKYQSPADFVWEALKLPLASPAPLQGIHDVLCYNGYKRLSEAIMDYVSLYDRNGSGSISYKDFTTISAQDFDPFANDETLEYIFNDFAKTKPGLITAEDLVQIGKKFLEDITLEEAKEMISVFDGDKDSAINFKEFKSIVKRR